jgi:hypoxanthine phosphoribosyltransferase
MRVLISSHDIQLRVREMAAHIHRDHPEGVHLIAVLKGAFVFLSDLARALPGPCSIDFMAVSSYGTRSSSSGQVQLLKDLDLLRARSPGSLRTACLLSKPSRRKVDVALDYVGFTIDDTFVVGYGLDAAEQYRNLPHIATLDVPDGGGLASRRTMIGDRASPHR